MQVRSMQVRFHPHVTLASHAACILEQPEPEVLMHQPQVRRRTVATAALQKQCRSLSPI